MSFFDLLGLFGRALLFFCYVKYFSLYHIQIWQVFYDGAKCNNQPKILNKITQSRGSWVKRKVPKVKFWNTSVRNPRVPDSNPLWPSTVTLFEFSTDFLNQLCQTSLGYIVFEETFSECTVRRPIVKVIQLARFNPRGSQWGKDYRKMMHPIALRY